MNLTARRSLWDLGRGQLDTITLFPSSPAKRLIYRRPGFSKEKKAKAKSLGVKQCLLPAELLLGLSDHPKPV